MRSMRRPLAALSLAAMLVVVFAAGIFLHTFFSPNGIEKITALSLGAHYLDEGPTIHQLHANDCAIACMRMLLREHGMPYDEVQLATQTSLTPSGTSMAEMLRILTSHHLAVQYQHLNPADLDRIPLPAIAFVRGDHFVIVSHVEPHTVTVLDPAIGRIRYARPLFRLNWSGDVLLVSPTSTHASL